MRQWTLGSWAYEWNANGSLKSVKKPSGQTISFEYDALGRRIAKRSGNKEILYIWSGNVLLHEVFKTNDNEQVITWVYEQGSFVPTAKLIDGEAYSIVSDYLGTPIRAYDEEGNLVWERELDIYGKVKTETRESANFVPFRYQGQYYDSEIDLCYNRFRYYDCNTGTYISQDPISILGGLNLYSYVFDSNGWVDVFGLVKGKTSFIGEALHPKSITPNNLGGVYTIQATGTYQGDKIALYKAIGLKESFSVEYVAHHISYDIETNTMQMQLVKQKIHSKVSHIGGVKEYKDAHNGEGYESVNKKKKITCKT
ncbi:RHS repeat-associated core domain-containing protein [Capnocytophaga canimorsus]|uniref:RHS repeat-associated core domain-containing protein n=1 Tax=Capnocytophaga canimorsus TaxID=28188 RepID=UPI0037D14F8D